MKHPMCGHDRSYSPEDFDVECCICADNPCVRVSVEQMREHRIYDIHLYTAHAREVGHVAPF